MKCLDISRQSVWVSLQFYCKKITVGQHFHLFCEREASFLVVSSALQSLGNGCELCAHSACQQLQTDGVTQTVAASDHKRV